MTRLQDDFYHAINGEWEKTADQLWKEHPHQQKGYTNYKKRVEKQ